MRRDLSLKGTVQEIDGSRKMVDQAVGARTPSSTCNNIGNGGDGQADAGGLISRLGPAGRETGGADASPVVQKGASQQCLLRRRRQQRNEEPSEALDTTALGEGADVRTATLTAATTRQNDAIFNQTPSTSSRCPLRRTAAFGVLACSGHEFECDERFD